MQVKLPSPTSIKDKELREYLSQLVQSIEHAFKKTTQLPLTKDKIKLTGVVTKQYTIDAVAGSPTDVLNVLVTLLKDLQDAGKIS